MTTKFTCVGVGFSGVNRVIERTAESAEKAADACAVALHTAYWTELWRQSEDRHGAYSEFTIKSGNRAVGTVRIYENYVH